MKQVKKFMIVPYQDNESSPEKEKIRKIIDNKSINSERKIKLINTILIPKLHRKMTQFLEKTILLMNKVKRVIKFLKTLFHELDQHLTQKQTCKKTNQTS